MDRLGIAGGELTKQDWQGRDKKRLRQADDQCKSKEKKRRQAEHLHRVRQEEALRQVEGVSYEAGAF